MAKGHCADFIGYCTVADKEATSSLTPGLWLMWKYEGSRTLSYYLRRRDTVRAISQVCVRRSAHPSFPRMDRPRCCLPAHDRRSHRPIRFFDAAPPGPWICGPP